jgi:hypothetical protein
MPFDPANVRILPPTLREPGHGASVPPVLPQERGGGDPRRQVRITIEVHMPAPPRHRPRSTLWWWVVALMGLALLVH